MQASSALTAADVALDELRADAAFAEAEHGKAYGASLLHYHAELAGFLRRAFELLGQSNDLSQNKRMRMAYVAHAVDIAQHVQEDIVTVRERFALAVAREAQVKPGARGALEGLIGQGRNRAEIWWDGRIRLGKSSTAIIVARDSRAYRRIPGWTGWAAGAGVFAVGGGLAASAFSLF